MTYHVDVVTDASVTTSGYRDAADVLAALGRHVYVVRTTLGMTQQQVGDALSVSHTVLSKLERGTQEPSLATAVRLLRWLDDVTSDDGPRDP